MRSLAALLMAISTLTAPPLAAQDIVYEVIEVEIGYSDSGGERFLSSHSQPVRPAAIPQGIASYGPFRVVDGERAALVDVTDTSSPADFAAMLRDYPGISVIEMVDCPGTDDDRANLRLGRMIRAAGIATYVPSGGSVRSGAVELFLSGAQRFADKGSEFAVHAWMDDLGRQASEYPLSSPENAKYLAFYRQMGMTEREATSFYAMTNSVPHEDALWLTGTQMAGWVRLDMDAAGKADIGPETGSAIGDAPLISYQFSAELVEAVPLG